MAPRRSAETSPLASRRAPAAAAAAAAAPHLSSRAQGARTQRSGCYKA